MTAAVSWGAPLTEIPPMSCSGEGYLILAITEGFVGSEFTGAVVRERRNEGTG